MIISDNVVVAVDVVVFVKPRCQWKFSFFFVRLFIFTTYDLYRVVGTYTYKKKHYILAMRKPLK